MPPGADPDNPDGATSPSRELGFRERIVAAAGASVVSAFVVNPLDVVKTRMQAQAAGASASSAAAVAAAAAASVPHNALLEKFAFTACPDSCPRSPGATATPGRGPHPRPSPFLSQSTLASMRHIARTEGLSQLWRGTDMALLMAVPMVGIYMPLYDYAKGALQPELGNSLAPLTAGALSRTAAVLCTAPLDLLRTRMQAMLKHTHLQPAVAGAPAVAASRTSQWMEIIRHVQAGSGSGTTARVGALWTGVGATLARDVPFSALYWALLEPVRDLLLPTESPTVPNLQQSSIIGPSFRAHASSSIPARPDVSSPAATEQRPESRMSSAAAKAEYRQAEPEGSQELASSSQHARMQWDGQEDHRCSSAADSGPASTSGRSSSQPGHCDSSGSRQSRDADGLPWHTGLHGSMHAEALTRQQHHQAGQPSLHQPHADAGSGLEDMRAAGLKDRGDAQAVTANTEDGVTKLQLLLANLVAGAVGGSAAAALTQPLDVVKTRAQLGHHGRSTSVYQALKELAQEGGVKALFTGVTPRALKAAPACAIVLASYETLKALYADS